MTDTYTAPTRTRTTHAARGATEAGVTITKPQREALDREDQAREREHKATRISGFIRTEALRDWTADKAEHERDQAATVEPEDFAPYAVPKPDVEDFAAMARSYRDARIDAQNDATRTFTSAAPAVWGKIEAAWLKAVNVLDPAEVSAVEYGSADLAADAAKAALYTFALWLAQAEGASKAETDLIRRAYKTGRLCTLTDARNIRSGKTPEAAAATEAQEAKAKAARDLNIESSGASARARNPKRADA